MVDFDLVLNMGPMLLVGVFFGTALGVSAPSWLVLACSVILILRRGDVDKGKLNSPQGAGR